MRSSDQRRLDLTYDAARHRFLDAAVAAGARVESHPHPARGREGEALAIDVATVGPDDADDVVLIVSGTHGVEGYAGSALQSWWLETHADPSIRIVFVHGLNPVGFSWVRRVNEDNVDLNRNFVDWEQPPPPNRGYGDLADLLVPTSWDDETQQATTHALLERAAEIGMDGLQQAVSGGQYAHPDGLFYGGTGPVWSHRWLTDHLDRVIGPCARLVVVDLHTGLGPWGHGELISTDRADSDAYRRGTDWWGDVRSMLDGASVSAELSGDWLQAIPQLAPGREVTAIAIEYGTVDMVTVLQSLRADAWLHAHGDPTEATAAAIRDQVRHAFVDDDPAWLATIIDRFDDVVGQAIRALTD
ncbi:MAG: M14 family metallopeptidase [Actinomycetota bacterium]